MSMNYENLSIACHGVLPNVIEKLQAMDPRDGIVDLIVKVTSYDAETDSMHVVESAIELCETTDGEWFVEEFWAKEHKHANG